MQIRSIHKIAEELVWFEQDKGLPLNSIIVARKHGLTCIPYPLGEVSVVLVIEKGKGSIGYNPKLTRAAYMFAIAHAMGHFFLHKHLNECFVDKNFYISKILTNVNHKDFSLERQAHEFAIALLMPELLLREEVEKLNLDLSDDEQIKILAKKFGVSVSALFYRLLGLKLI